jgi:5-methylcytosine-specific restriction endonuclease McrA
MSKVQDPILEQAKAQKRAKAASRQKTYRKSHPIEIIARRAVYYQTHRVEIIAHQATYAQSHKTQITIRESDYRKTHHNVIAARAAIYRQEHRIMAREYSMVYRKAHKAEQIAYNALYLRTHLVTHSLSEAKRRAQKQSAGGIFTEMDWNQVKAIYKERCAYCGKRTKLTMDHIVPLVNGGFHGSPNIVPACRSCNSRKGVRPPPPFQLAQDIGVLGTEAIP